MAVEDAEKFVSLEPATSTSNAKKRKVKLEEIEVDITQPEPPSKKAKRLLKRGKALPIKPASDDDDEAEDDVNLSTKSKSGNDGEKKSKRSEYGVWIGNLPWTLSRADLFKWFVESSGGAITDESITRVNMPASKLGGAKDSRMHADRVKPQNKGFAYVDFDTEAACVAAMALTEAELSGRKVLIKNSSSFEGRPQPVKEEETTSTADGTGGVAAASKNNTSRKIYVGNLSFQTNEDDLWAHFEKCGEIDWVKAATFEDTGKCKGYGWVKFKQVEAAEAAAQGFVRIKEVIETEDDFMDEQGGSEERAQTKMFKTRKWWVNRLKGRELKIEFAEDDQVRYKKRYGKDGTSRKQGTREGDFAPEGAAEEKKNAAPRKPAPPKAKGYGESNVKSYLTGSVVKPEGKKVTFD